jgi:hypothetical protein
MRYMKKQLIIPALVVVMGGAAILGANRIFAQTTEGETPSIVQKIAQKFNLNEADVKAVFDEEHQARHAEMEAKRLERLDQLVKDGKITEEQKQLIISKHEEMEANREAMFAEMEGKTAEERRALKIKHHEELNSWAEENGIDPQYLMFKIKFKGHGGPGKMIIAE